MAVTVYCTVCKKPMGDESGTTLIAGEEVPMHYICYKDGPLKSTTDTKKQARIEARLKKIIAAIPNGNEWNKSGDDCLFELGVELLSKGMGLTDIEYHFNRIYWAIASEFGG